jgi:hypothetical protein
MQRPKGVTILAVLAFIGAGFLVLAALGFMFGAAFMSRFAASGGTPAGGGFLLGLGAVAGIFFLCFAALYAVTGIGLIGLKNWGRILTIILVALGLLSAAFGLLGSLTHFSFGLLIRQVIIAAIDLWILIYLFKPHVKQAFGAT